MDKTFLPGDYIPVLVQFVIVFGFVLITMTLTHYIGGKRKRIHYCDFGIQHSYFLIC